MVPRCYISVYNRKSPRSPSGVREQVERGAGRGCVEVTGWAAPTPGGLRGRWSTAPCTSPGGGDGGGARILWQVRSGGGQVQPNTKVEVQSIAYLVPGKSAGWRCRGAGLRWRKIVQSCCRGAQGGVRSGQGTWGVWARRFNKSRKKEAKLVHRNSEPSK